MLPTIHNTDLYHTLWVAADPGKVFRVRKNEVVDHAADPRLGATISYPSGDVGINWVVSGQLVFQAEPADRSSGIYAAILSLDKVDCRATITVATSAGHAVVWAGMIEQLAAVGFQAIIGRSLGSLLERALLDAVDDLKVQCATTIHLRRMLVDDAKKLTKSVPGAFPTLHALLTRRMKLPMHCVCAWLPIWHAYTGGSFLHFIEELDGDRAPWWAQFDLLAGFHETHRKAILDRTGGAA